MQTQTPPTTKKAPRYSVMKNDSLGFVKVNKTMVQVFLFPLKNKVRANLPRRLYSNMSHRHYFCNRARYRD